MSAVLASPAPAPAEPAGAGSPAEPEAPVTKYDFDRFFQSKIAALTLRDGTFMLRVDGLIRPEYFESQAEAYLVNLALKYFEKYKRLPADASIYGRMIREEVVARTLKSELAKLVASTMTELYKMDISDRDFVVDEVSTFARHQAVAKAMHECVAKLDKKDFGFIEKRMKTALDVGAHVDTGAYNFDDMLDARLGERLDRCAGLRPPTGITTGYPGIDERLYHKGWGRRELAVIMGSAKKGKTTAMIDFGINAFAAGHNVLYVTLEVAASIIAERMDANISRTAMFELGAKCHAVNAEVRKFIDDVKKGAGREGKGKFVIHEFPAGDFTVKDLRRLTERYKGRGIVFDMIIVDYADIMAPERYTDNSQENSKSVYVGLRGFAMMENVAILTATQTNRQGHVAQVARAEHVAEDFNKIRIADIVISINATEEELAARQARLFFAACRNQAGGYAIRIEQDLQRMKFVAKVLGVE